MEQLFEPLGLHHVVLHVKDQAASRRFYTELLGCTVDHVNEKLSLVQLRFGQNLIDLLPLGSHSLAPSPDTGMDHLCLSIRCDDLGKVAVAPRARGVAEEGEVMERRGAFGAGESI